MERKTIPPAMPSSATPTTAGTGGPIISPAVGRSRTVTGIPSLLPTSAPGTIPAPSPQAASSPKVRPAETMMGAISAAEVADPEFVAHAPRAQMARTESSVAITAVPVSLYKDARYELVVAHSNLYNNEEESAPYRQLRHALWSRHRPQVILVTSARKKERKTTVAVNLAFAFAELAPGKTLLISGQQDKRLFELGLVDASTCLSAQIVQFAKNDAEFSSRIVPLRVTELAPASLHVAAIASDQWVAPLQYSMVVRQLIAALRGSYDHIIVDGASVLESVYAQVIAEYTDGVVFAVHRKHTQKGDLRIARGRLSGTPVLGSVILS